jgi:pimeloyl-ACP methyl ester carboxylesterase
MSNEQSGVYPDGIPYRRIGSGPWNLVVLAGGPGNEMPSSFMLGIIANGMEPLLGEYTIYWLSRKSGLQRGYSTRVIAADFADLIDDEFGAAVDLIGFSMGGFIAQQLAIDRPDLVRRLVLHSTAYCIPEGPYVTRLEESALLKRDGKIGAAYLAETPEAGGLIRFLLRVVPSMMITVDNPSYAEDVMIEYQAALEHNTRERLHSIKAPTLVTGVENDRYFPPVFVRETAGLIPDARVIIYEGRGHYESPFDEEFSKDALAFFTEIGRL